MKLECEWCDEFPKYRCYPRGIRNNIDGTKLASYRFACANHIDKVRQLMRLDGFDSWEEDEPEPTIYKTAYEIAAKDRERYKKVFDALMLIKEELERG